MTSKTSNVFEKRVEKVFKGYEITQYRECKTRGWVEFYWSNDDKLMNNELPLKTLLELSEILRTTNITINAWTEATACSKCGEDENFGYLVAYDVKL